MLILALHFSAYKTKIFPNQLVQKQYQTQLQKLTFASDFFHQQSIHFSNQKITKKALLDSYLELRKAYKKSEFLINYLDASVIEQFVNAAPLLHLEENAPSMNVLQPEGLQVIDEYLYSDEIDIQVVVELANKLNNQLKNIIVNHKAIQITDRQIFEAIRMECIRVLTLGITGFDTPASLQGVNETQYIFESMANTFQIYADEQPSKKRKKMAKEIVELLTKGQKYVQKNNNFDSFNRFEFIQKYINPVYEKVLEFHLETGVETMYETQFKQFPINYYAKNIFANDFLNTSYFLHEYKNENQNVVTNLGKMLFFDPVLSQNNERSCASCHNPEKAFTDGQAKSIAFDFKGTVNRNSPTLINSIYADRLFHDLRSENLKGQIEHVIFSEKEFHTNYHEIVQKLNQSKEYKEYFQKAFPNQPISKFTLSRALANYVKTLTGFNSDFDKSIRNEKEANPEVVAGFNLFMGKGNCGTCHFAPTFSGLVAPHFKESESEVLGMTATNDLKTPVLDADLGRFSSTVIKDKVDFYKHSFKTSTVRNIALTAPYMHNGAFKTLDEVLDFYNQGGGKGLGLNVPNQTLGEDKLNLTTNEINQLKAFMNALTDTTNLVSKPKKLPLFPTKKLNNRVIGGKY